MIPPAQRISNVTFVLSLGGIKVKETFYKKFVRVLNPSGLATMKSFHSFIICYLKSLVPNVELSLVKMAGAHI